MPEEFDIEQIPTTYQEFFSKYGWKPPLHTGLGSNFFDYYKIFGLEEGFTDGELKKNYHKLARKFHPDKNPASSEIFQTIALGYETLLDSVNKAEYLRNLKDERLRRETPAYSSASTPSAPRAKPEESAQDKIFGFINRHKLKVTIHDLRIDTDLVRLIKNAYLNELNNPGSVSESVRNIEKYIDESLPLKKSYIFIQKHLPDLSDISFLQKYKDTDFVKDIAATFDQELQPNYNSDEVNETVWSIKVLSFLDRYFPSQDYSFLAAYPQTQEVIADAYNKEFSEPETFKNTLNIVKTFSALNPNPYEVDVDFLYNPEIMRIISDTYKKFSEDEALNLIKSLIFLNRHKLTPMVDSFLKHTENMKIIANAYDKNLSDQKTLNLIKSRIFINKHLPDLKDISFLNSHPDTAQKIAEAYDNELSNPLSINKSLKRIKSRIFINRHLPHLQDLSFLNNYPKAAKIKQIASIYDQEISGEHKNLDAIKSLNLIKSLCFLNKHLPSLKDVSFLNVYPGTAKLIAYAYDKELSTPEKSAIAVNRALNLIKSHSFIKENIPNIGTISFLKSYPKAAEVIARAYDDQNEIKSSHAINLIKSLSFINSNLPKLKEKDVSFLNNDPEAAKVLASAYDNNLTGDIALNQIKSLIFLNEHRSKLQDVLPDTQVGSFLNSHPETAKKIAEAYDKKQSDPQNSSDSFNTALELIKARLALNAARTPPPKPPRRLTPIDGNLLAANINTSYSAEELAANDERRAARLAARVQDKDRNQYNRYLEQSKTYLDYLEGKKPKTKSNTAKIEKMRNAINILNSNSNDPQIANDLFIKHIQDNLSVFRKQMDPGFKKFLKKLGVAAAKILSFLRIVSQVPKQHKTQQFLNDIGIEKQRSKQHQFKNSLNFIKRKPTPKNQPDEPPPPRP